MDPVPSFMAASDMQFYNVSIGSRTTRGGTEYNDGMQVPSWLIQRSIGIAIFAMTCHFEVHCQTTFQPDQSAEEDCTNFDAQIKSLMGAVENARTLLSDASNPYEDSIKLLKDATARMLSTPRDRCLAQNPVYFSSLRLPFMGLLRRWGYNINMRLPFSEQTVSAVKAYQQRRELPQSGAFDYATMRKLLDDLELLAPFEWQATLPEKEVHFEMWDTGSVSASGTWNLEAQTGAMLAQTTEIQCDKSTMQCRETTAYLGAGNLLSIEHYVHSIARWDDTEIVTEPEDRLCFRVVRRLNRTTQEITGSQYKTNSDFMCGAADSREKHLRLVDGSFIKSRHNELKSTIWSQDIEDLMNELSASSSKDRN